MPFRTELSRAAFLKLLAGAATVLVAGDGKAAKGATMNTRPIPKTGEKLPVVGLGTWQTFDVGSNAEERAPLAEVLGLLFQAGGSVIDSSPMYGRSEAVVGDLLETLGKRKAAFLATKVWTSGRESGIRQMQQSLTRFRTERIDLMQIHNLLDWRTHLPTLRDWKADGRLRYIGITHYTTSAMDDLAGIIETESLDFVQLPYSIALRDAEKRLLPLAAERGVAVVVNRPFEGGDMFPKTRGKPLPAWTAEFDCGSWGQFFLKFILAHPAVTCVIPGTSKPKHMADNVQAGMGRLPDAGQRRRMVTFWKEL